MKARDRLSFIATNKQDGGAVDSPAVAVTGRLFS